MSPTVLFRLFFGLVLFVLFPVFLSAQSTIRGVVRDEAGEPVMDATVTLEGTQLGALTNDEGIFSISKIPEGSYTLRISYIGKETLEQQVDALKNGVKTLDRLTLSESATTLEEIEVVGHRHGEIERQNVDVAVTPITTREINLLPSLGTPDLAQYLQVLPGVVFTGDQGGQLFIRGGTPIQNMVLMDGAIIYNPFHTIGLFSVFDTDMIRSVDVYSAGFGAEFGGRVSSVMDVKTRSGNFKEYGGKVFGNTIAGGLLAEGPLFKKKGEETGIASFLLSARQGYLDQTSQSLYSYVNDTAGLPFRFSDIFGKITLGSGVNQISFFGFRHADAVDYGYPSSYEWQSSGGGSNFIFLPPGSKMIISGNVAVSSYRNEQTVVDEAFPRYSEIGGFNSRLNFSYLFNQADELAYGFQILGFNTDFEFTNGLGLATRQQNFNTELAGYAKYKKVFRTGGKTEGSTPFDRAVLEPSIRLHFYNDASHVAVEPRLRGKLNFNRFSLQGAVGMYTQNLISAGSDRDVVQLFQGYLTAPDDLRDPFLGNNLQASWHALAGIQLELLPYLQTTVEGWYKRFTQLTTVNRERLFSEDPAFIVEKGTAYGIDLSLKYQKKNIYLYGTYSYMMSERDDRIAVYNPVFDRRHTVNIVASYQGGEITRKDNNRRLASRWEVSSRWSFGSGFPFTQTQGFFEKLTFAGRGSQTDLSALDGQLSLLLADEYNGGRLPSFHRLDFSVKYRFRVFTRSILEFNVNAINVYDRANIFYFDRARFVRVNQLPFLPTAGFSFQF